MERTEIERTVTRVIDGDTFEVDRAINGAMSVRLANYDAPEKDQPDGQKATDMLKRLIDGRTVTIKPKSTSYDRIVAEVFYNGENVTDLLRKQ